MYWTRRGITWRYQGMHMAALTMACALGGSWRGLLMGLGFCVFAWMLSCIDFGDRPPPTWEENPDDAYQRRVVLLTVNACKVWPASHVNVTPFKAEVILDNGPDEAMGRPKYYAIARAEGSYALDGLEAMVAKMLAEHARKPRDRT